MAGLLALDAQSIPDGGRASWGEAARQRARAPRGETQNDIKFHFISLRFTFKTHLKRL